MTRISEEKGVYVAVILMGFLILASGCDKATQLKPAATPDSGNQSVLTGATLEHPTQVTLTDLGQADPIITLRIVGLNRGGSLEIRGDGLAHLEEYGNMAGVRSGESNYSRTSRLLPEQLAKLVALFREAGFLDMQDEYIEQDPPGQIIEMDYVHITFRDGGRTKSIKIRGSSGRPLALIELQDALFEIKSSLEKDITLSGTP